MNDIVLAFADDMTGALETGAKFSAAGISTLVTTKAAETGESFQAIVFDTETRHRTPQAAASAIREFALHSRAVQPRLIYKKTDSTLRGNIAAELQALGELFPTFRAGYAPAYPALGRTVRDGILYVYGTPVARTEFGSDALNPVQNSSVAEVAGLAECTIFDGETDDDVTRAARTILTDPDMRIAVGPAALAEAIAREIDLPRSQPPRLPHIRSCLVLNGSRHPASARQVLYASQQQMGDWRMIGIEHAPGTDAHEVAKRNAQHAGEILPALLPDAILVMGGDTAFALVTELGMPRLLPVGEVATGVPLTRIVLPEGKRDLFLITKAGGFGEPDLLCRIRERLLHDG